MDLLIDQTLAGLWFGRLVVQSLHKPCVCLCIRSKFEGSLAGRLFQSNSAGCQRVESRLVLPSQPEIVATLAFLAFASIYLTRRTGNPLADQALTTSRIILR